MSDPSRPLVRPFAPPRRCPAQAELPWTGSDGRDGRGGAGILLRVLLIVMVVGCALTAWFLLRGYSRKDD
ncbi:hypothetical protein [Streptomyces sp. NPDC059781]|uniref:hypothetical protein n=1 Tax=unclassified Streptomyces TaxID=2593676 RepID=UPI003649F051